MITTASKFFYGLAGLLVVAAIAYGYSTGGGNVGPLSLGYKGAVGDLVGYIILMGAGVVAAFLGFVTTAFRDADPAAVADHLGASTPPSVATPANSYWPIIGAFGVGLTVIGVVINNVFFVAGLIVLGAVAVEWTIQNWSEQATGDPAVNREIRNRIMLPLEVPVAALLVAGVVIVGYSRVFLAVSQEGAVWIAMAIAAIIFIVGTVLSTRDRVRTDLVAGLLAIGAVVTIGLGIVSAVNGEREFHEHEEEEVEPDDSQTGEDPAAEEDGAALQESN
ncbi:MAG: hypothetical protein ACSLFO_13915 [Acidimicrobiales bacterium]